MNHHCSVCNFFQEKLEQQEQTIAQLLAIIAVTNRKLTDISHKQELLEQTNLLTSHYLRSILAIESTTITSHVPQLKK